MCCNWHWDLLVISNTTVCNVFLRLADRKHTLENTRYLLVQILLVKGKTLHFETSSFPDSLPYEDYYPAFFFLAPISKVKITRDQWAKQEATISCLVFSHQKHTRNNACNCSLRQRHFHAAFALLVCTFRKSCSCLV
jgi:hypothetical protein